MNMADLPCNILLPENSAQFPKDGSYNLLDGYSFHDLVLEAYRSRYNMNHDLWPISYGS